MLSLEWCTLSYHCLMKITWQLFHFIALIIYHAFITPHKKVNLLPVHYQRETERNIDVICHYHILLFSELSCNKDGLLATTLGMVMVETSYLNTGNWFVPTSTMWVFETALLNKKVVYGACALFQHPPMYEKWFSVNIISIFMTQGLGGHINEFMLPQNI